MDFAAAALNMLIEKNAAQKKSSLREMFF